MWPRTLVAALLGLAAAAPAAPAAPAFAVVTAADGNLHVYPTATRVSLTRYQVEDTIVQAVLDDSGSGQWQLTIRAKQALRSQYFPWQVQRTALGDPADDFYYYPYILGTSEKASARNVDWTWWGRRYPGEIFAPLAVMADATAAILVAATNWPPRSVTPLYAAQRLVLRYDEILAPGDTSSYGALLVRVSGNQDTGQVPWQLALDQYRAWLDRRLPVPEYPSWMWAGEGFLNVQLENAPFSAEALDDLWRPIRAVYPWVLFWGQMTTTGQGCCVLTQVMSRSYHPALPRYVANSVVAAGYHAGYYSAPNYSASGPRLDTPAGLAWLVKWLELNREYGANSYYIDTLGRQYHGEPVRILELFARGIIPQATLIEGAVDIYPAASLVSGALAGDADLCGAPQKSPPRAARTTFPRLGRYLLRDRLIFSGQSNTDWRFWGRGLWQSETDGFSAGCEYRAWCAANGPCEYGAERLNFLLGAKLDVMTPGPNPVLDAILAERQRVGWWARRPVYLDTRGLDLTSLPAASAVEVRRFCDRNGFDLLAISNPHSLRGLYFRVDGKTVAVPPRPIAIVDLFAGGA